MINFYIFSKRSHLKFNELSNSNIASLAKKEHGFTVHFCKDLPSFYKQYLMNDQLRFVETFSFLKF